MTGSAPPSDEVDPFDGPDWATSRAGVEPGTAPPERRRRRVSLRRLRRRRRVALAMMIVGGLIVLTFAWLLITGLLARSQLEQVRAQISKLKAEINAGDLTAARVTAVGMQSHARRAHLLTTGPAWAVMADLPGGGEPLQTVRVMTAEVDALSAHVLPQLVDASRSIDPTTLRRSDGSFDLGRIGAAAPALDRADRRMTQAQHAVQAAPAHTWLGPVDSARSQLLGQLTSLGHTVRSADLAARLAPQLLGGQGVQRYFVAFQNDAEARGTGGIPGAFAIVRADRGKLSFERFGSDSELFGVQVNVGLGADYARLYRGWGTQTMFGNANISPHFPYAAQIWLAMWKKHTGQTLDGVMAVDPTVLSYLLAVTGPAQLPDKTYVTGANVVALSQSTVYTRYPAPRDQAARKEFLLELARAASERILAGGHDTTALVRAAARGAGERRLLLYSRDPKVEADLQGTTLGGALQDTDAPYVGLSLVNEAGNKLDYYLDRSLTWKRTGCGRTRDVTVTVQLTNNAPARGLSEYVAGRHDRHGYPIRLGDNRLDVSFFATRGAQLDSITLDGKPWTAGNGTTLGHPVFTADVELPRGRTRTLVLHLREPAGHGSPIVLRQPLVRPLVVAVDDANCG